MELGLEIEGEEFGALGLDDDLVLGGDGVLEAEQVLFGDLVAVVEGHDEAGLAGVFVDRDDLGEDAEALVAVLLHEAGGERTGGPVDVVDEGGVAGAVGVGLPDANVARFGAAGAKGDFVVFDLEVLGVAKHAGMDVAEVGDVEEIFDDARAAGVEGVGPARTTRKEGSSA